MVVLSRDIKASRTIISNSLIIGKVSYRFAYYKNLEVVIALGGGLFK
jgi:hypothetical protein